MAVDELVELLLFNALATLSQEHRLGEGCHLLVGIRDPILHKPWHFSHWFITDLCHSHLMIFLKQLNT